MSLRSLIALVTLISLGFTTFAHAQAATDAARAPALFKGAFELYQAAQYDAAVLGFEEGLKLDPDNPVGHYYLAETLARQGRMDLALPHYERTVALAPDSKEGLIVRARLPKWRQLGEASQAMKLWVGKWQGKGLGVFEVNAFAGDLIMVWHRPDPLYADTFRGGEIFARGALKGPAWEGTVGDTAKDSHEWRCFNGDPRTPMIARLYDDGRTMMMDKGNIEWSFDPCRPSRSTHPHEISAWGNRVTYYFYRIAD